MVYPLIANNYIFAIVHEIIIKIISCILARKTHQERDIVRVTLDAQICRKQHPPDTCISSKKVSKR